MAGASSLMQVGGQTSTLAATITGPSFSASGTATSHSFGSNTCTASGGTSPYTYLWSVKADANGTWTTGGTSSSFTPSVSAVFLGDLTIATYVCTVTDSAGATVKSNSVQYQYANTV